MNSPQVISNLNYFPNVAFGAKVYQLTARLFDFDYNTPPERQGNPVPVPLFGTNLFPMLYSELFSSVSPRSSVDNSPFGLAQVSEPRALGDFPALPPEFTFRSSSGSLIMSVKIECNQIFYLDLLQFLVKEKLRVKNIRYTVVFETTPEATANVSGRLRSSQIYFFTKDLLGNFQLQEINVGSMIDPKTNLSSRGLGANAAGNSITQYVIDFPVDFILSERSGIAFPVLCNADDNVAFSEVVSAEASFVICREEDNCLKKSKPLI